MLTGRRRRGRATSRSSSAPPATPTAARPAPCHPRFIDPGTRAAPGQTSSAIPSGCWAAPAASPAARAAAFSAGRETGTRVLRTATKRFRGVPRCESFRDRWQGGRFSLLGSRGRRVRGAGARPRPKPHHRAAPRDLPLDLLRTAVHPHGRRRRTRRDDHLPLEGRQRAGPGHFPVILDMTPYGRDGECGVRLGERLRAARLRARRRRRARHGRQPGQPRRQLLLAALGARRLRAGRVPRHPAVVQRQGRDVRRLLPRHHAVPHGRAAARRTSPRSRPTRRCPTSTTTRRSPAASSRCSSTPSTWQSRARRAC